MQDYLIIIPLLILYALVLGYFVRLLIALMFRPVITIMEIMDVRRTEGTENDNRRV
jgi:hypothetical protein